MLGDDAGAADEIALVLAHTHGRRLGHAADQHAMGIAVHDQVADHMHLDALELVAGCAQIVEGETFPFQQRHQLFGGDAGRLGLDDVGRGIDDVARREEDFAAIAFDGGFLLGGARDAGRLLVYS